MAMLAQNLKDEEAARRKRKWKSKSKKGKKAVELESDLEIESEVESISALQPEEEEDIKPVFSKDPLPNISKPLISHTPFRIKIKVPYVNPGGHLMWKFATFSLPGYKELVT
jgi:hypothetical protein